MKTSTKEIIEDIKSDFEGHLDKVMSRIEKYEKKINSFITLIDIDKKSVKNRGVLEGLLIAVKDNILVEGIRCTAGSKMLENYISPYNATVIERIKREGGIIIGKTNMDEFACGSDGTKSAFGPTKNPIDLSRVPGGSSSGSAAALKAGFCDLALGSDTGGSIRCPSCFCSVFGMKPTYGLVSRYGLIDMAMSFEQIGPMANDIYGLALLLDVISGKDHRDSTTVDKPVDSFVNFIEKIDEKYFNGKKVVIFKEFFERISKIVERKFFKAMDILLSFDIEIREISFEEIKYIVPIYYILVFSEFSSAMQRYDGLKYGFRGECSDLWKCIMKSRKILGEEVKRRILLGTYITSKFCYKDLFLRVNYIRERIKKKISEIFKEFDFILSPTMPTLPWKIGEIQDSVEMYQMDILTVLANVCGIPALNVPISEMIGLQIMGKWFRDHEVLSLGKIFEMYLLKKWD